MAYRILVIEDEPEMQVMLRDNLRYEGYDVLSAETGELGLEMGLTNRPDLVLLDVVLPRMSGYSVCQRLRSGGFGSPIIMITARNSEIDRVTGLDLGADDYIGKPFSVSELMARVRAQLRRLERVESEPARFTFGRIVVDPEGRQVFRDGVPIELSSHEFGLLLYLIRHEGEAISRDQLLKDVWGYPELPLTRTIDNFVARLRGKVEEKPHQPRHIMTVHGVGYRFVR
ncbi:MAG: response regulator transcription factor [Vicinamibacterales bacterium]